MTDYERNLLESNLKKFKTFMEFVKFTYAHDIEFDHDEWVEFRDKYFEIKKNGKPNKYGIESAPIEFRLRIIEVIADLIIFIFILNHFT